MGGYKKTLLSTGGGLHLSFNVFNKLYMYNGRKTVTANADYR